MIFWFKGHGHGGHDKAEQVAKNKERDIKVRAHQLHMQNSVAQDKVAEGGMGTEASPEAAEGIDEDFRSKIGAERKAMKEKGQQQLSSMRARVRLGRRKAKSRGRSLGF